MKKTICQLALLFAAASLAGCGLKGPLYFPSDEAKTQAAPAAAPAPATAAPAGQDKKTVQ